MRDDMPVEILLTFARYLCAVLVGFVIGRIFAIRAQKEDGTEVKRPIVNKTNRNFTLLVITLLVLAVISVVSTAVQVSKQADCNQQFRDALTARAVITQEETKLQDELTQLNTSDANGLRDFLTVILQQPEDAPEGSLDDELASYQKLVADNAEKRNDVLQRRDELRQERAENPLPEPTCGT
jgi:hypothetical protein